MFPPRTVKRGWPMPGRSLRRSTYVPSSPRCTPVDELLGFGLTGVRSFSVRTIIAAGGWGTGLPTGGRGPFPLGPGGASAMLLFALFLGGSAAAVGAGVVERARVAGVAGVAVVAAVAAISAPFLF